MGEVINATLVAKSTIAFMLVKKKESSIIVPITTVKIHTQYNDWLFGFLSPNNISVVGLNTLGKASKQVSVVLNMVVKAAMAIIK